MYKTTIVIWSEYPGTNRELSSLAHQAEDGDAICTIYRSEKIGDPAADQDWTEDAENFFTREDEDDDLEDDPIAEAVAQAWMFGDETDGS